MRRVLYDLACRGLQVGEIGTIRVASPSKTASDFMSTMRDAIELTKTVNKRYHDRTVSNIRWLVNSANGGGPGSVTFRVPYGSCRVDYSDFDWGNDLWVAGHYSVGIVRCATIGQLNRLGVTANQGNWSRFWTICHNESMRYVKKLDETIPGVAEKWIKDVNLSRPSTSTYLISTLKRGFSKIRSEVLEN